MKKLQPIQDKRQSLKDNKQMVMEILNEGAKKARAIAQKQ